MKTGVALCLNIKEKQYFLRGDCFFAGCFVLANGSQRGTPKFRGFRLDIAYKDGYVLL